MNFPDASDYQYSKVIISDVVLQSELVNTAINITNAVTDFDVFEHIDKPYLTASVFIADTYGLYEMFGFLGGEQISLKIESTARDSVAVKKTFVVDYVSNLTQLHTGAIGFTLHLIEDIAYVSSLTNVNQSYEGTGSGIITKMSLDYLGKSLSIFGADFQEKFKIIVPNMTPIEAMIWVKNKITNVDGMPFFLYSTFVGDLMNFQDLGTILTRPAINEGKPLTNMQPTGSSESYPGQRRTIKSYMFHETTPLHEIVKKGLVGASHGRINTLYGQNQTHEFNIYKDVIEKLEKKLSTKQNKFRDIHKFLLNGKSISELKSSRITEVVGSGVYDNVKSFLPSYDEHTNRDDYKLQTVSKSVFELLTRSPMEIIVDGKDFMTGRDHFTIGNILSIDLLSSNLELINNSTRSAVDRRRSGNYLIYSARHIFRKEGYDIRLSCVKVGDIE